MGCADPGPRWDPQGGGGHRGLGVGQVGGGDGPTAGGGAVVWAPRAPQEAPAQQQHTMKGDMDTSSVPPCPSENSEFFLK